MFYADRPIVIGHRGSGKSALAGADAPTENTAAAMERAFRDGADGVEFDVQRSSDNELVVYHNSLLPNGDRLRLHTAAALLSDFGVESLASVMAGIPAGAVVNIEVKTGYDQGDEQLDYAMVGPLIEYLNGAGAASYKNVVSCFDSAALRELRDAVATPLALLTAPHDVRDRTDMPLLAAISWARSLGAQALHAHTEQFSVHEPATLRREIAEVHAAELGLLVWCPAPQQAVELIRAGADAVCVDFVPETVALARTIER